MIKYNLIHVFLVFVLGAILQLPGGVQAGVLVDNDFAQHSLGPEWSRIGGNDRWGLDGNRLIYRAPTVADSLLLNKSVDLNDAPAWKMEVGMRFPDLSLWTGVAFNIKQTNPGSVHLSGHSFYVLRVNPVRNAIQWLKYPGGGSATPEVLVNTISTVNLPGAHLTSGGHLGGGRSGAVADALMGSDLISDFFAFYRIFFL